MTRALLAIVCVAVHSLAADLADIPEVKTRGDLIKAAPIDVGDGVTIRLGIEAKKFPRNSGVLIYCLTENFKMPDDYGANDNMLGPVRVRYFWENEPKREDIRSRGQLAQLPIDLQKSRVLYTKLIPGTKDGKCHIEIRSKKDNGLLSETIVECTTDESHTWMPWGRPTKEIAPQELVAKKDEDESMYGSVGNRRTGIALPYFNPLAPMIFDRLNVRTSDEQLLQVAIPSEVDEGFKLTVDDKLELTITAKEEFLVCRPDWHFLTRWWVNGKPYIAEQMEPEGDANGLVVEGKKLKIALEFNAANLGAKKGDKIGLQLLYCRNGWRLVSSQDTLHEAMESVDGKPLFKLSNKVEFVAP